MGKKYSIKAKLLSVLALTAYFVSVVNPAHAQTANTGSKASKVMLNPLLPGYFADPTIKNLAIPTISTPLPITSCWPRARQPFGTVKIL